MKKYWIILVMLLMVNKGFSQEPGPRVMEQVEAQKVAFFTKTLDLTVEESQSFWPIYNKYQDDHKALRQQYSPNFKNRNMSDQEAAKTIEDFLEMEEKMLMLKRQLYSDLSAVMPPGKIVKLQFAEKQFKQKLLDRIKKRRESRHRK